MKRYSIYKVIILWDRSDVDGWWFKEIHYIQRYYPENLRSERWGRTMISKDTVYIKLLSWKLLHLSVIRIRFAIIKDVMRRTDNTMAKTTNNHLQNSTQKTKDWVPRTPLSNCQSISLIKEIQFNVQKYI